MTLDRILLLLSFAIAELIFMFIGPVTALSCLILFAGEAVVFIGYEAIRRVYMYVSQHSLHQNKKTSINN